MNLVEMMNIRMAEKTKMVDKANALSGSDQPINTAATHFVLNTAIQPPYPGECESALFGFGCFWGAEKRFWSLPGIYTTAVGSSAGYTPNPTYEEVCTGKTGHNEVVLVVYYPEQLDYLELLKVFWEAHNPTQGMRQGNDIGTQYRSGIYTYSEKQLKLAEVSKVQYQQALAENKFDKISTEILAATDLYYAEAYHQQYLAKNPQGYCGLGGTGVCMPDNLQSNREVE